MSANDAKPVPSQMNLQQMKQKKKGASQGHSLLKKKSDALTVRFRGLLKEIVSTKLAIGEEQKSASFLYARAVWSAGEFKNPLIESIKRPGITLDIKTDNVAGVRLPKFEILVDPSVDVMGNIGVAAGRQMISSARDKFLLTLNSLIQLASLQTSFFTLDEEIKMTNRRVNALSNVVIPKIENDVNYIIRELDEMEREDFFRLKKVQKKKIEKAEIEEKLKLKEKLKNENEMQIEQNQNKTNNAINKMNGHSKHLPTMLDNEQDDDIIF